MEADLLVRSKWMVSREFGTEDIPKEPLVTIASVIKPDAKEEKTRTKNRGVLTFKESFAKPLEMNATHLAAMKLMFGNETNNWIDKQIKVGAIVGVYFKKRQTAVRILGSPQLKEAKSFSVRSFGGGSDVYNLAPISEGGTTPVNGKSAPTPFVPDGTLKFKIGKLQGTQLAVLARAELEEAISFGRDWLAKVKPGANGIPATLGHVAEIEAEQARRARLEEQMASGAPPPGATTAEPGSDDAPF